VPLDNSVWDQFPPATPEQQQWMAPQAAQDAALRQSQARMTPATLPAWATGGEGDEAAPKAVAQTVKAATVWDQFPAAAPEQTKWIDPATAQKLGIKAPPEQGSTLGGIGRNLGAGLAEGGWNAAAMLPNAANAVTNLGIRGLNAVAGTQIPQFNTDVGGEASRALARATGGFSPTEVQPHGEPERVARAVGQVPGQLGGMALGGAGLEAAAPFLAPTTAAITRGVGQTLRETPIARSALPVAAGAATGQVAEDVAPDWAKPYANIVGNLIGGGAAAIGQEGALSVGRAAANAAGRMGIGPKQSLGGVAVTGSQARQVGEELNAVPGLLPKLRATEDTQELVPGSKPTLAQAAFTPGGEPLAPDALARVAGMEKDARVANPGPFIAREAEQNSARLAAIQGQADTNASPQSVGQMFTRGLDALETQKATQAGAAGAARTAAAGPPLGGLQRTEEYGAGMHEGLSTEQATVKAARSSLFDLVPRDMTAAANPAKDAAAKVLASVGPIQGIETGAELHPSVEKIATTISKWPDVVPFDVFRDIRSQLSEASRKIAGDPQVGAESVAMRQVTDLKRGVDQSIQDAVNRAIAPQSTVGKALVTELSAISDRAAAENGAVASSQNSAAGIGEGPSGPTGAGISAQGGLPMPPGATNSARNAGAGRPPLEERITPEGAQAYKTAVAGWADYKGTYRQGPVGEALATDANKNRKTSDLMLPAKFFRRGDVDPAAVGAYIKAAGSNTSAVELAKDYLVSELRHAGIIDPKTGAMNVSDFDAWARQRQPAIQQLDAASGEALAPKLANARTAQEFYDQTVAQHEAAIKDYQNGVAKSFLGQDPVQAISRTLAANDPTKFTALARAVAGNADAREGLKRAVVDWLDQKVSSSTAATETEDFMKANVFRTWIERNKQPLKILFGGQGLQNFEMIGADLRRQAQRTQAVPGSRTSTDVAAGHKTGMFGGHGKSLFSFIAGEAAGTAAGHALNLPILGEALGGVGGVVVSALRQHGIDTVNALRREAFLHPDLARVLMERVANDKPGPVLMRRLAARLQTTLLANQLGGRKDEPQ